MSRLWVVLVLVGVLALSGLAYAAPTQEQQEELAEIHSRMAELRKEMVSKQAELGIISQAEAEFRIKRIEAQAAYREKLGIGGIRRRQGVAGRAWGNAGRAMPGRMRPNRMGRTGGMMRGMCW